LSNAYLYDAEIAEAVQRRLANINYATHWREQSTLWLTLQRRFIYVEGCVAPGFDKRTFLAELAKTADVERVIDNTITDPHAAQLPYRTQSNPDKPVRDPGN
jgi:O-acetylhomoserine/O-acetylserine sulfhydrylase-like pyridoxal-dependent enzyme